jgi:glutamate carboxypeptidase
LIHLDTVWPSGSLAENPFRVEDGVAYGPGIRDMKGGWVVLLEALRVLREAGWDGLEQCTVFMTGDEQLGSPRGRQWIEREADAADWALVMEPARDGGELVTHRGLVGALAIDIHGIATHSTNRRNGAHTIAEAAHKILLLEGLGDDERGLIVSVGIVQGGSSRQYTAAHTWLSVDLRAPSNEEADELLARIQEIARHAHVSGTRSVVTGGVTRPATTLLPGTERLLELAQACGSTVGIDVRGAYARGGSDGNFTAALGVPTLDGLGIQGAGGTGLEENALLDSIPARAAMLAGIIEGLPGLLDEA